MAELGATEAVLHRATDQLERRVEERTADLTRINRLITKGETRWMFAAGGPVSAAEGVIAIYGVPAG